MSDSKKRMHRLELGTPKMEDLPNGGLLIHDVPMLAEGTWTDSAVQTPLFYPAKTLEKDAANWLDLSGWSRHSGGTPRRAQDKVASLEKPHYDPASKAVVGDIRLHGYTQDSRDMAALVKNGEIKWVSVEHGGNEEYNPTEKRMEATSLVFSTFAFVNRGACDVCRTNEAGSVEGEQMELKELEGKYGDTVKELESAKLEIASLKKSQAEYAQVSDSAKKLADALDKATKTIESQDERLKALEKAAKDPKTGLVDEDRKLEPFARIKVDNEGKINLIEEV